MCHFNNGQGEYALIDVAENAVDSHVGHGDTLFADDQDCDGLLDDPCPLLHACYDSEPTYPSIEVEWVSDYCNMDRQRFSDGPIFSGAPWLYPDISTANPNGVLYEYPNTNGESTYVYVNQGADYDCAASFLDTYGSEGMAECNGSWAPDCGPIFEGKNGCDCASSQGWF